MAESILAAALMFWSSGRMGFFQGCIFFFMLGVTSLVSLMTLFRGFRDLRIFKILGDTPRATIGSVALGLVNIRGKAEADKPIPSPVSHTPCCFYKVILDQWNFSNKEKDGTRTAFWSPVTTARDGTRFFLVDNTGKALIDLGNDRDVRRTTVRFDERKPESIRSHFVSVYELKEHSARELDPHQRNASAAGASDEELWSYIWQRLQDPTRAGVNKRYRLTEFLVLPGEEYQVIGTCVENTDAKGLGDRNLICKGKGIPLIISSAPEDIPMNELSAGATADIVGGAFASVACLGFLLAFIAWLLNDQVTLESEHAQMAGWVWMGSIAAAFLLMILLRWMFAKPDSN